MATTLLTYPCPKCNQKVRVKAPQKAGIYKITCPHCQYKANLKLPGLDTLGQAQANNPQAPSAPTPPPSPMQRQRPVPPQMPPRPAGNVKPPQMPPQMPASQGINVCNAAPANEAAPQKTFVVNNPKMPKAAGPDLPLGPAKLERLGKMFNDSYPLRPGIITIGRYDNAVQSDIAIKGDTFMSRRSVSIEMRCIGIEGFTYCLRVLSSTNPVLINGRSVPVGTEVFLNFGDTFVMGRTRFRLDKA